MEERTRRHDSDQASDSTETNGRRREGPEVRRIGRFRITRLLGSGGQGEVYLAYDEVLKRSVALKTLSRRVEACSSEVRREYLSRFKREAEAVSRLSHSTICSVFDFGEEEGLPWMALQYVEGMTLQDRIAELRDSEFSKDDFFSLSEGTCVIDDRSKRRDEEAPGSSTSSAPARRDINAIASFFEKLSRGLHTAHEAGLVHRDIKPGNVMIDTQGDPILLDFGLALDEFGASTQLTETGRLLGTPLYLSPEQITGNRIRIDRRSDIFSLGVTMYESLTLTRPFEAPTRDGLYRKIQFSQPAPCHAINSAVPVDLGTIVEHCMEKDPDRRYQTAEDLAADLRRFLDHEPVRARKTPTSRKLGLWCRRNPVLATSTLIGLFAICSVAGVLAISNRRLDARNVELDATNTRLRIAEGKARRLASSLREQGDLGVLIRVEKEFETGAWPPNDESVASLASLVADVQPILGRQGEYEGRLAALKTGTGANPPGGIEGDQTGEVEASSLSVLEKIVSTLRRFQRQDDGLLARIDRRLNRCREVLRRTVGDQDARSLWARCRRRIAENPRYRSLDLPPQDGLIPLGPDPSSHLEEFLDDASHDPLAPIPTRDGRGALPNVTETTGAILVLLPAGEFTMGAQSQDTSRRNYDPQAEPDEGPPRVVTLSSFFIGKHELTRGQWKRMTGQSDPSWWTKDTSKKMFGDELIGDTDPREFPVDSVSWVEAVAGLKRAGLRLPSEAEWEYACRAGTSTPWSFGDDARDFPRFANLRDSGSKNWPRGTSATGNDGFPLVAPVGRLRPNLFGLHDMHGNLWEWCEDRYGAYPGADEVQEEHDDRLKTRVLRGGCFSRLPWSARSADRNRYPQAESMNLWGLRVARSIV
ncbi:MAG TPA: hypothetical protein ENK43_14910, partial [Planctomycetes bacterium]|nr:hypothetical protein [Planctomycetota bacterium]